MNTALSVQLSAKHLTKSFDGLIAVNDVSLDLKIGQIHALIGPNGAGKSTMIGLLTGFITLDSGQITLGTQNITTIKPEKRAKLGLSTSYQITSIMRELSVIENINLALLSTTHQHCISMRGYAKHPELMANAHELLDQFELDSSADLTAGQLSHGQQSRLEMAMCLAIQPNVLLLDEPMSGMTQADGQQMISLLSQTKNNMAMLLVEHDMDTVFELADIISVMVSGQIIATDKPDDIRNNEAVINAYLGKSEC